MFLKENDRRLVPRWRDFQTTVRLGELSSPKKVHLSEDFQDTGLEKLIETWEIDKNPIITSELMGAAFVLGRDETALEAAQCLLASDSQFSRSSARLAKQIAIPSSVSLEGPENSDIAGTYENRSSIHELRKRLHDEPRNAVAYVDMALVYAMLGFADQAKRAMDLAIILAPNNRFVLRSAARLYVHLAEPDKAHSLLRRSRPINKDPWLLAAEISVADVAGKTSGFMKRARSLLKAPHDPWHFSELAGSLATQEMISGSNRNARQLFRSALEEPTDNVVAQVDWAYRKMGNIELTENYYLVPRSYEARSRDLYKKGDWGSALTQVINWQHDEPFSARPAYFGSFLAAAVLEDYPTSAKIARQSLVSNPTDSLLQNNLVYALACAGNIQEATEHFAKIKHHELDSLGLVTWLATSGLLHFRSGQIESGRLLYEQAMLSASGESNRILKAMVAQFLAHEELNADTSFALQAFQRAEKEAESTSDPDVDVIQQKLKKSLGSRRSALYATSPKSPRNRPI